MVGILSATDEKTRIHNTGWNYSILYLMLASISLFYFSRDWLKLIRTSTSSVPSFQAFMKIYVSEQGKPHFKGGNIFPMAHSVFCLMPKPEICSFLWNEKLLEILFIRSVFFQFSRLEKYSLLEHRRKRKTSGMQKETKKTPSSPKVCK